MLEGRGVDLFMIETFFDLDELVSAVEAVRGVSSLPIVALLTFDDDAEVAGGIDAAAAAERLAGLDVAAIGTNHGAGPHAALLALDGMRDAGPPARGAARTSASPASPAAASSTRTRRPSTSATSPPRRSRSAPGSWAAAAARRRPRSRPSGRRSTTSGPRARRSRRASGARCRPPLPAAGETQLARALREGEWVVSVELDPPKGGTNDAMIDVARALRDSGAVGFVDVNDNPMARARMNALMASIAIQREAGIETIPHVTPRDTTVMGLEGVLLGAHADGVRNVLAVTGDPPHVGDYPGSRGVYEIDSIGLVQLLAGLNEGVDYVGKAIDRPTEFFIGVAVNPSADDLELELERFERKVAAGARFAMTQALFDLDGLERFLARLGGSSPIPLLAGVWPLRSHAMALRLHNEVPGISVPERVLDALRDAGADAPAAGLALAHELLASLRGRVAGVYVIPPFKQPEAALDLLLRLTRASAVDAGRLERLDARARDRRPHDVRRHAVAAVGAHALGEDRRDHATLGVDDGPARVAAADRAADRRHPPRRSGSSRTRRGRRSARRDRRARRSRCRGRCPGSRAARPGCPAPHRRAASGRATRPATRRTAMSLTLSNETTRASSSSPSLRSTRGVPIPATTCAFVTTRPGPATQPEPSIPSPQAVPTTRTTLSAAPLTPAESRTAGSGASTPAAGPASVANGSICASVSIRRCGGSSWLSFERIAESWA